MRTLLLSLVFLLSACAATEPALPPETLAGTGTTAGTPNETPNDNTAESRRGRRAALWTGIGFALYAIYEANDDDSAAPVSGSLCLAPGMSIKCW